MDNEEIFVMHDENGMEREARILNVIEMEGHEYLVYSLSVNEEEDAIYVAKIVKNGDNEDITSIDDEVEREKVFSVIEEMFNSVEEE